MSIRVRCACGRESLVQPEQSGSAHRCPSCGQSLRIAASEDAASGAVQSDSLDDGLTVPDEDELLPDDEESALTGYALASPDGAPTSVDDELTLPDDDDEESFSGYALARPDDDARSTEDHDPRRNDLPEPSPPIAARDDDAEAGELPPVLEKLAAPFRFYHDHRRGLWLEFAAQFSLPVLAARRAKEVMLPGWDRYDSGYWSVVLPATHCAACGGKSAGPPVRRERTVTDLKAPLWSPLVGLAFGLVFWVFWSSETILVLSLMGGFLGGWASRTEYEATIEACYCRPHRASRYPELRVFDGDLFVLLGDRKVKQAYVSLQREKRQQTRRDARPAAADADRSAQRAAAEKRLQERASQAPDAAAADRRYAQRRRETIAKPTRFPEARYVLAPAFPFRNSLSVRDQSGEEVARVRKAAWPLKGVKIAAPPEEAPYLTINKGEIKTRDLKRVGKVVLMHQRGMLKSASLSYYGRLLSYDAPRITDEPGGFFKRIGRALAGTLDAFDLRGAAMGILALVCLPLLPFIILFRAFRGRRWSEIEFTQDQVPVASLDVVARGLGKHYVLERHAEGSDLELCLIFSTLWALDEVGPILAPCELSSDALQ